MAFPPGASRSFRLLSDKPIRFAFGRRAALTPLSSVAY